MRGADFASGGLALLLVGLFAGLSEGLFTRLDATRLDAGLSGDAGVDRAEPRLVGLVELPGLFGTRDPDGPPGAVLPAEPAPVPLHAEPDTGSPRVATVSFADSLEWRELDYEAPAALAYGTKDGWVRVALREESGRRYGWVPPEHRGALHTLSVLLQRGLPYLTDEWDGLLRDAPCMESDASRHDGVGSDDPVDVRVLEGVDSEGAIWLRVELLEPGRCHAAAPPAVTATGWVPALADDGSPNAWFYSRGC